MKRKGHLSVCSECFLILSFVSPFIFGFAFESMILVLVVKVLCHYTTFCLPVSVVGGDWVQFRLWFSLDFLLLLSVIGSKSDYKKNTRDPYNQNHKTLTSK